MKTRVTITLDADTHQLAKRAARARRTSVSGLINSLLRRTENPLPSMVDEMIGSVTLREAPAPGSDPKYDALKAKYLDR